MELRLVLVSGLGSGRRRAVELCEERGVELVVHMGQVVARVPEVDARLRGEAAREVGRVVTRGLGVGVGVGVGVG